MHQLYLFQQLNVCQQNRSDVVHHRLLVPVYRESPIFGPVKELLVHGIRIEELMPELTKAAEVPLHHHHIALWRYAVIVNLAKVLVLLKSLHHSYLIIQIVEHASLVLVLTELLQLDCHGRRALK